MTTTIKTPQMMQGRARGLLLVWRRELEWKLQINQYLLGCSRGATLEIMAEMDRRPEDRPRILDHPKTLDHSDQDHSHTKSIRTRYQQMGSPPRGNTTAVA